MSIHSKTLPSVPYLALAFLFMGHLKSHLSVRLLLLDRGGDICCYFLTMQQKVLGVAGDGPPPLHLSHLLQDRDKQRKHNLLCIKGKISNSTSI
jgi:hypothetical protein